MACWLSRYYDPLLMTSENQREAAKYNGDVFRCDVGEALNRILTPGEDAALMLHIAAIQNGLLLRILEQALLYIDDTPDDRFVALCEFLHCNPDYLPAGILPQESEDGQEQLEGNSAHAEARATLRQELKDRLPTQYPQLYQFLKEPDFQGILEPLHEHLSPSKKMEEEV